MSDRMGREYPTLVTSLPHLPYFERAERVPLTELALKQRLSMLEEDDAAQIRGAVNLLAWRRHSIAALTEHIQQQFRKIIETTQNPALLEYIDWRIGGRTAMAALRLKGMGQVTPPAKPWGVGRFVRLIEVNWDKSDVGLAPVFPWLPEARQLLASGETLALERLQMAVAWRKLTRMGESKPFGFEFVAAYVFKWDILQRWLANDPYKAKVRFEKLIKEVISEHQLACR
jgi:hypothetical protein